MVSPSTGQSSGCEGVDVHLVDCVELSIHQASTPRAKLPAQVQVRRNQAEIAAGIREQARVADYRPQSVRGGFSTSHAQS